MAATVVDRVILDGERAVAVVTSGGELRGGTVVLAARAYGTPAILLRSGITHLPVGENLADLKAAKLRFDARAVDSYVWLFGRGSGLLLRPMLFHARAQIPETAERRKTVGRESVGWAWRIGRCSSPSHCDAAALALREWTPALLALAREARGLPIVSSPRRLYADPRVLGGRGEEAAEHVRKELIGF